MTVREIHLLGSPVLRQRAVEIEPDRIAGPTLHHGAATARAGIDRAMGTDMRGSLLRRGQCSVDIGARAAARVSDAETLKLL